MQPNTKLYFRGTRRPEVFPIIGSHGKNLKEITQGLTDSQRIYTTDCAKTLKGEGGGQGAKTGLYAITRNRSDAKYKENNISPTLRNGDKQDIRIIDKKGKDKNKDYASTLKSEGGGRGAKTGLYSIPMPKKSYAIDANYAKGCNDLTKCRRTVVPVITPDRPNKRQNGRRFKEEGDPSFTLTAQDRHGIYDGCKIRRLTPTECERLQGFADGWTELGIIHNSKEYIEKCAKKGKVLEEEVITKISDSQRYKVLGNAVTVNVIQAIMERLLNDC